MKHFYLLLAKFFTVITLVLFSSSAFATGATVRFILPNPTAVPTLSTTMLLILSLLLFVVAIKIARNKNTNVKKFTLLLLGSGLVLGVGSGAKLVSDVQASATLTPIMFGSGQTFVEYPIEGPASPFPIKAVGRYSSVVPVDFLITADPDSECTYYGNGIVNVDTPAASLAGSLAANVEMEVSCGAPQINITPLK